MADQMLRRQLGCVPHGGAVAVVHIGDKIQEVLTMEAEQLASDAIRSSGDRELSSLHDALDWLNTQPLTASDLRGRVVLIDFWTYTCVNWLRTLPYVRGWAEKYQEHGLVVIGVHTPEFPFEKDVGNVRRAVRDMGIEYPVAIDSDYTIWQAFDNHYWPALYFIDAQGKIRDSHFGEGEYERSERTIQQLLAEAGVTDIDHNLVSVHPGGAEVAADWGSVGSGENYLGYDRTNKFASPDGPTFDVPRHYVAPANLRLNQWALSGDWTFGEWASASDAANGRIAYRFHARDVNLVMGPAKPGTTVRFRALLDGQPPGVAHGADVDERGNGSVSEQRLYQLIRQPKPITDRQFEIEFLDVGVEAFVFTFG